MKNYSANVMALAKTIILDTRNVMVLAELVTLGPYSYRLKKKPIFCND